MPKRQGASATPAHATAEAECRGQNGAREAEEWPFVVDLGGGSCAVSGDGELVLHGLRLAVNGRALVDDARVVLARGQRYGLIGKNGCGKSALLQALASPGSRALQGLDPAALRCALVTQEHPSLLQQCTVLEYIVGGDERVVACTRELNALEEDPSTPTEQEASRMAALVEQLELLDADTLEQRARLIAEGVGLHRARWYSPLAELSGGMRMRAELARALVSSPSLLLLDEPTNHLDLEAKDWLQSFLTQKADSGNRAVVLVSHDAAFLDAVCTHMLQLHGGSLVCTPGNYSEFEERAAQHCSWQTGLLEKTAKKEEKLRGFIEEQRQRAHAGKHDDNMLRQANRRADKKLERLGYYRSDGKPYRLYSLKYLGAKWSRYPQRVEQLTKDPTLRFVFGDPKRNTGSGGAQTAAEQAAVLSLFDVSFTYPGADTPTLQHVTLQSRVALVGRNGAGKSTLLKVLCGQLSGEPSTSTRSEEGCGEVWREHGHRVALVAQHHIEALQDSAHLSAVDYLLSRVPELRNAHEARQHLGKFGLSHGVPLLRIGALSGGLKARLVFAEVMYYEPSVLCMDEPTNHLDFESIEALSLAVASFAGAVVMVSHNSGFLCTVCDELWTVSTDGRVTAAKACAEGEEGASFEELFRAYRGAAVGREMDRGVVRWQAHGWSRSTVSTAAF